MNKAATALLLVTAAAAQAGQPEDDLLEAVRKGDATAVKALLDRGVSPDTKYRYDRTPLSFAADRGQLGIVKLLLERGASPDAKDTFYGSTALGWAAGKGHTEVVLALLARNPNGGVALMAAARAKQAETAEAVLATGKVSARDQSYVLAMAERSGATAVAERLRSRGVVPPPKADQTIDPAVLARYAGRYRNEKDDQDAFGLSVADGVLSADYGGRTSKLGAIDARHFHVEGTGVTLEMVLEGERAIGVVVTDIGSETRYQRAEEAKP